MNRVLFNLLKGNTLLFLIMFVNSIILARLYPTEEIALIRTLSLYGSFIVVLGTFQIHVSILKYVTKISQDYFRIVSSIKFVFLVSLLFTTLYYIVVISIFSFSSNLVYYLLYGVILVPLVFFNMLQSFYIVTDQSKKYTSQIFLFGLMFIPLTFVVGYYNLDLKYYFIGLLFVYLVMLYPWKKDIITLCLQEIKNNEISKIRDQIKYSAPLTFSNLLYLCMSRFDKLWMTLTYSANIVGSYFVVSFENPMNGIVISSTMNEITHSMSKLLGDNNTVKLWEKWKYSIFQITSLLFLPSLLLFFNANLFVSYFFGEKYLDNVFIFKLYCLTPLVRTASYQSLLRVFGYTKFHLVNAIISLVITLITGVLIMFLLEYYYFPLAYLMGYLSYNLGVAIYVCVKEKISFYDVFGVSIIVKQITIVLLVYVLFLFLDLENKNFIISNFTLVTIYIFIYTLFFYKKIKTFFNENNI